MSDKENRKCFKCGSTPLRDKIKLFRFPKPGVRNVLRCQQWAEFIFPEKQHSIELLNKLFSEHRMLCQKHFKDTDFVNNTKMKLLRYAVPSNIELQTPNLPGPSHIVPLFENLPGPSYLMPSLDIVPNISGNVSHVSSHSLLRDISNQTQCQKPNLPDRTQLVSSLDINTSKTLLEIVPSTSGSAPKSSHSSLQGVSNVITMKSTESAYEKHDKCNITLAKCRKYMRQVCQLRNRIKKLKNEGVIKNLSDDIAVKRLSKRLTPAFARILQDQLKNFKKKGTGRRWSNEVKITALRMYKRSPTCYRLLRRIFNLPSENTLKNMLNKLPFNVGVHDPVMKVLENFTKTQKEKDSQYILMFDEMSLKKHLNYNPKTDQIEGYQDHASQGRSPLIAAYALVFMIAGIRKRVKQPIAHYFSSGFSTADRLAVLIKEVLHECFRSGLNITAVVCDMDGVNRRALSILGASSQHPLITVCNKQIISFFDPPHLLKCFRNLFIKYDIECDTNISSDEKKGRGIAKWAHIRQFYEIDNANPNFVYAPALKKDHLDPNTKQKMKVKLAAQVLSHSVAGGMYAKISAGELTADAVVTAEVVANMDKLFDAINSTLQIEEEVNYTQQI